MKADLRLGLFHFKNDDVLLLAASPQAAGALAETLESAATKGDFEIAIHEMASVSRKHPARLFASSKLAPSLKPEEFWWRCSDTDIERLKDIASRAGEHYFNLSRPEDLFKIACHSFYNAKWWETYG